MPPLTIKLKKPVKVLGPTGLTERSELVFREPSAEDVLDLGMPSITMRSAPNTDGTVDDDPQMRFEPNMPVVRKYIRRLSDVDSSVLSQLPPGVPNKVWGWLQDLLNEDDEEEGAGNQTEKNSVQPSAS